MSPSWRAWFGKRRARPQAPTPERDPFAIDVTGTPLAEMIESAVKRAPVYVTTGGKPRAVLVDFEWWKRFSAEIEDASK